MYEQQIKDYLMKMQRLCITQTGEIMSVDDYIGHLQSEEFEEKFGKMSLEVLLGLLIKA